MKRQRLSHISIVWQRRHELDLDYDEIPKSPSPTTNGYDESWQLNVAVPDEDEFAQATQLLELSIAKNTISSIRRELEAAREALAVLARKEHDKKQALEEHKEIEGLLREELREAHAAQEETNKRHTQIVQGLNRDVIAYREALRPLEAERDALLKCLAEADEKTQQLTSALKEAQEVNQALQRDVRKKDNYITELHRTGDLQDDKMRQSDKKIIALKAAIQEMQTKESLREKSRSIRSPEISKKNNVSPRPNVTRTFEYLPKSDGPGLSHTDLQLGHSLSSHDIPNQVQGAVLEQQAKSYTPEQKPAAAMLAEQRGRSDLSGEAHAAEPSISLSMGPTNGSLHAQSRLEHLNDVDIHPHDVLLRELQSSIAMQVHAVVDRAKEVPASDDEEEPKAAMSSETQPRIDIQERVHADAPMQTQVKIDEMEVDAGMLSEHDTLNDVQDQPQPQGAMQTQVRIDEMEVDAGILSEHDTMKDAQDEPQPQGAMQDDGI